MANIQRIILSTILMLIVAFAASAQRITITPQSDEKVVSVPGTVTFRGNGITLEEIAKRYNLKHIQGRTYNSAIIYSVAFTSQRAKGKIYNCTDSSVKIKCYYYYNTTLLKQEIIEVKPRTFSRLLYSEGTCNKIVCSK